MLTDFAANARPFDLELARCEAKVRSILTMKSPAAPRAKALLTTMSRFRSRPRRGQRETAIQESDEAWAIYAALNGLIEELRRVAFLNQIGMR